MIHKNCVLKNPSKTGVTKTRHSKMGYKGGRENKGNKGGTA